MPELPEVETTKTSLAPLLGQKVSAVQVFQPQLRWLMPEDLDHLVGYTLQSVERRAKYLILNFERLPSTYEQDSKSKPRADSRKIIMHLGMSGSLQQHPLGTQKRKHDHLLLLFKDDNNVTTQLHYHDPRRFGAVLDFEGYYDKLLAHLGPEPLSDDFDADYLYHFIQRTDKQQATQNLNEDCAKQAPSTSRKRAIMKPIKSVIMEQQVVVGVGNIYASESLYLSGIHPATPAAQLSYEQIDVLVTHIKAILKKAITLGGSTLRDFTVASGQTGYFQQTLNVYGRQGELCPSCDTTLDNIKLNARASVFCPICQPLQEEQS